VRAPRKACDPKFVLRPSDLPQFGIIEHHLWPFLREVEEGVGIDRRDDRGNAICRQRLDGISRNLCDVEPAAQGEHHDRPVECSDIVKGRGEHVHRFQFANS